MEYKLKQGDNLELLKELPDNSIDSIVSDPPYGLSFMNKKWDYDVPSVELWKEVYRVLKPGGHVLSFGGTRTYHRMVVNMEDAGFEIRDQIMWLYGSGFPKSHNISKAIDKVEGNERKVIGRKIQRVDGTLRNVGATGAPFLINGVEGSMSKSTDGYIDIEEPGSENSKRYEGWGTALKPANEPICLARKPLSEKSVAENVLKWGTGGINIDGCRIDLNGDNTGRKLSGANDGIFNCSKVVGSVDDKWKEGRFPANIILECICDEVIKGDKGEPFNYKGKEYNNKDTSMFNGDKPEAPSNYNDKGDIHTNPNCTCRLMDEQSGNLKSTGAIRGKDTDTDPTSFDMKKKAGNNSNPYAGQVGGASRYFYQAKVSKKERNMGLDGFEIKINIGTIKLLIYKRKNQILWERQDLNQTHQVDTEQSHQKDIEEFITKEECVWNTELFGNYIMEKFQKDIKSITEMKTNSIMIYQTLNSLIQKSTKEYIATQQKELMDGIKFVESADKKNTKAIITYQKKDGLNQNVSPVSLKEVWSISVEEEVKSNHPTMKPVNLMAYLCRLITPPGGTILDPYMGSGSTGIAALLEGFNFIGMDLDPEYVKIAEARIKNYEKYREFLKK